MLERKLTNGELPQDVQNEIFHLRAQKSMLVAFVREVLRETTIIDRLFHMAEDLLQTIGDDNG